MEKLFQGIIEQAFDDLFDEQEREKTWRWFNYTGPVTHPHMVTFQDACDLANLEAVRMKERARKLYYGEVTEHAYKEAKKLKNVRALEIVETHAQIVDYENLPRTSYLYTNMEAADYIATLH